MLAARLTWLPLPGAVFTWVTVQKMARAASRRARDPDMRAIALRVIGDDLPGKDYYAECARCLRFVRESIRYVQDPRAVEHLVEPKALLLHVGQEDCESMCSLLACLWLCLGHAAGYEIVKADPESPTEFSHVYCVVRLGFGQPWLPADPTEPTQRLGEDPTRGRRVWGKKTYAIDAERDRAVRVEPEPEVTSSLEWAR